MHLLPERVQLAVMISNAAIALLASCTAVELPLPPHAAITNMLDRTAITYDFFIESPWLYVFTHIAMRRNTQGKPMPIAMASVRQKLAKRFLDELWIVSR